MINKELKRLTRRELVDIIYQMKKNEQQMQEEIAKLQTALEDKRIKIDQAGSVADAAASITSLLSAAQETADLYLSEINCMKDAAKKECERIINDAKNSAEKKLAEGEKQLETLRTEYLAEYEKFQQLRSEVQSLEQAKKDGLSEDDKGNG